MAAIYIRSIDPRLRQKVPRRSFSTSEVKLYSNACFGHRSLFSEPRALDLKTITLNDPSMRVIRTH